MVPNDKVERRGGALPAKKLIYPNHRLPPWLTEDATRDRSNRLLGGANFDEFALRRRWRDRFTGLT